MFHEPPRRTATKDNTLGHLVTIVLCVIVLANMGWLFSSHGLYLGYVIAALLGVATLLAGYVYFGRRRLNKQLAHIERLERQEAQAHDEHA